MAGIGGKKMPLDRVGSRIKPEDMRKWIRTPKTMKGDSTMKAYPNLPEKDLSDLIAFLMTLK
jgi:cytochrome c1